MILLFQVVGLVALLLDILSVQRKRRKHILMMQIAASSTWAVHFLLIGATAGAAMNAVGIVRSMSYFSNRRRRYARVPVMIMVLSVVVTALTWQGTLSLLPMMAMIIAAAAFWQRNEQVIRILLITAVPFWFAYNLIAHSYAGMTSDVLALVSTSTALYRYRRQGFATSPALTS